MDNMKTKILTLTMFLLTSCGGSGGGGSSSASNPITGYWVEQFANPSLNIYLTVGASSFTVQQSTCTISGQITVDANYVHVVNASRTAGCISGPSSFDCTYYMPSNNQLDLSCPGLSASLTRN
jgi:hypothetical protein